MEIPTTRASPAGAAFSSQYTSAPRNAGKGKTTCMTLRNGRSLPKRLRGGRGEFQISNFKREASWPPFFVLELMLNPLEPDCKPYIKVL